ncbi:hypothetical protein EGH25_05260 [Haladaptatus sp. F3-133]|uniref:Uncharacterized protein n=1 Tax=Halorutilus salinus TaxID=2487751 RepID=A0A9Q4C3T6_9EURY|nr:hypothetical protein [Halorutilus salinus]MCX2818758.1 hypothetical protein [Halorutilus salinus]
MEKETHRRRTDTEQVPNDGSLSCSSDNTRVSLGEASDEPLNRLAEWRRRERDGIPR